EKQRLMLARTLSFGPRMLMMDEPCAALDPEVKVTWLLDLRKLIDQQQLLIVYITHDYNEARLIADQILFLEKTGEAEGVVGTVIPTAISLFSSDPGSALAGSFVFYPFFTKVPLAVVPASLRTRLHARAHALGIDGRSVAFGETDGIPVTV